MDNPAAIQAASMFASQPLRSAVVIEAQQLTLYSAFHLPLLLTREKISCTQDVNIGVLHMELPETPDDKTSRSSF